MQVNHDIFVYDMVQVLDGALVVSTFKDDGLKNIIVEKNTAYNKRLISMSQLRK